MKLVYFLNTKKKVLSIVPHFLKDVYLKKKFYLLPENKFIRGIIIFVYVKLLRKLLIATELLFKVKINWGNPKRFKYIIFDDDSLEVVDKVLPKDKYFVLTTRVQKFREIYLSKQIIIYILKNFFKKSLKFNYIISIIQLVRPEKIITWIDNSVDFHNVSKFFDKSNITFYALQNAVRNEIYFNEIFSIANYNGNYFCFGDYEINSIKKSSFHSPQLKLKAIGSLKIELAKEFLRKENKNQLSQTYDICFISESGGEIGTSGSLTKLQYEQDQKIAATIFRYTQFFCKKFKKKLLFLGRHDLRNKKDEHNKEEEFLFYKYKNDVDDFKLQFFDKSKYENIKNLLQSEVIIGQASTLLREAFGLKKKVLVCEGEIKESKHDFSTIDFPGGGIMKLQSIKYSDFEKRLLEILNINYDEYLLKTKDPKLVYNLNFNTLEFLREEFK